MSKFMQETQDDDFCLIYDASQTEQFDKQFYDVVERHSGTPFSLTLSDGTNIYYYFNYHVPQVDEIASHIHRVHRCRSCTKRVSEQLGYSGVDGFAVDLSHPEDGPYNMISALLNRSNPGALQTLKPVVIVSKDMDNRMPRVAGRDPTTGEEWMHLGINPQPEHCSMVNLAKKIQKCHLLQNLTNGTMDSKMGKIFDGGLFERDLSLIEQVIKGDNENNVKRKESFWNYRIAYLRELIEYAKHSPYITTGTSLYWTKINENGKMHLKMFAILNGGPSQWTSSGLNVLWQSIGQVLDLSQDATDLDSLPGLMNSRSDPTTYGTQQIDDARRKHNATDPISGSLAWNTPCDLDLVACDQEGRICDYRHMKVGSMYLRFDANACESTKDPVENMAFTGPGKYKLYVNMYCHRDKNKRQVPFQVQMSINGVKHLFEGVWDTDVRGSNAPVKGYTKSTLSKMMFITTVDVTAEMCAVSKQGGDLSAKQANRLCALIPKFKEAFGDFKTRLANVGDYDDAEIVSLSKPNAVVDTSTHLENLMLKVKDSKQKQNKKNKKRTTLTERVYKELNSMDAICKAVRAGTTVSMTIVGRDHKPTIATYHDGCQQNLKVPVCLSTYYRNGNAPSQPDPDSTLEQCRFDNEWCADTETSISSTLPFSVSHVCFLKHPNGSYSGYFLALKGTRLPNLGGSWTNAAGMFASDLKMDHHDVREVWGSHHTDVRPEHGDCGIGIFVHSGTKFTATVNGVEKSITV